MGDQYYRFFPGDYLRDTGDLTLVEHGAYHIMLHHVYSGADLPADRGRLNRICRAVTEEEQKAVDLIATRYFRKVGGILRNPKADREMRGRRDFLLRQSDRGKRSAVKRKEKTLNQGLGSTKCLVQPPSPSPSPSPLPPPLPPPFQSKGSRSKPLSGAKSPDGVSNNIPYGEIIKHLNTRTGKSFRENAEATRKLIRGRWDEGFRIEDFLSVIENQARDWMGDEKMEKYLRPETLFGKSKFEGYLNNTASRPRGEPKGWKGLRDYMQELEDEKNDAGRVPGRDRTTVLDVS